MKKVVIISLLVAYSQFSNAQKVTGASNDTTPGVSNSVSVDERLKKQEQQVKTLRKDNEELKQQVKQLRSSSFKTSSKVTVSRTGSKQVIIE